MYIICGICKTLLSSKYDNLFREKKKTQNYTNNNLSIVHQKAQFSTTKLDEHSLLCEEINPDVFAITKHSFKGETINLLKIKNCELASVVYLSDFNSGGVATFVRRSLKYIPN